MSGDVHVRFYERLGVRFPRATLHLILRRTTDDDGATTVGTKCIVMHVHPTARHIGAVLAIATTVHVEAMTEGAAEFDIVTRFIT
jgi:predicted thioesterase